MSMLPKTRRLKSIRHAISQFIKIVTSIQTVFYDNNQLLEWNNLISSMHQYLKTNVIFTLKVDVDADTDIDMSYCDRQKDRIVD